MTSNKCFMNVMEAVRGLHETLKNTPLNDASSKTDRDFCYSITLQKDCFGTTLRVHISVYDLLRMAQDLKLTCLLSYLETQSFHLETVDAQGIQWCACAPLSEKLKYEDLLKEVDVRERQFWP